MTIFGKKQKGVKEGFILLGMSLCFSQWGFAQTNTSYEDRLSQIGSKEANRSLGTISGRNKDEMKKKELFDAYTYVPAGEIKKEDVKSKSVERETFKEDYVEFRKEHKIPNYIGDDAAKGALKKAKDDTMKVEVVKIVEAEKLLQDTFKAYHEEKEKTEHESNLLNKMGSKKDFGVAAYQKEINDRIDLVGENTASILNTSIQKLSGSKLIDEMEPKQEVYLTSGGRVFPKLDLEEDKDFLNVRNHVMERVQRDLMTALASAINTFYHTEQKETSKAGIMEKEQLLAFVRVEDKETWHQAMKHERMEAIKKWTNSGGANSGGWATAIRPTSEKYVGLESNRAVVDPATAGPGGYVGLESNRAVVDPTTAGPGGYVGLDSNRAVVNPGGSPAPEVPPVGQ